MAKGRQTPAERPQRVRHDLDGLWPAAPEPGGHFLFTPTRAAALARLEWFVPASGRSYAATRNYDFGPDRRENVSLLSPYLRHRLITEAEVVARVCAAHGPAEVDKFIQEVVWRAYWRGWLQTHPTLHAAAMAAIEPARATVDADKARAKLLTAALAGTTGIACFDAWVAELLSTGYLHNHARMWFASIWCFTLRLPWVLGADFFFKHLLDADAASNTLSWRWVAGLHTPGKHYLARADNIRLNTKDRFDPVGQLNETASPLNDDLPALSLNISTWHPPAMPSSAGRTALLLHDDDLGIDSDWPLDGVAAVAVLRLPHIADQAGPAARFTDGCAHDAAQRASAALNVAADVLTPDRIIAWATSHAVERILTPYAPAGLAAWALADLGLKLAERGIALHQLIRPWDRAVSPHATRGFFQLKAKIPSLLTQPELFR
jgi:deoxyribodipyrimidine photo-lyase